MRQLVRLEGNTPMPDGIKVNVKPKRSTLFREAQRPKVIIYTEGKVDLNGVSNILEICPQEEPQAHNCPMELK